MNAWTFTEKCHVMYFKVDTITTTATRCYIYPTQHCISLIVTIITTTSRQRKLIACTIKHEYYFWELFFLIFPFSTKECLFWDSIHNAITCVILHFHFKPWRTLKTYNNEHKKSHIVLGIYSIDKIDFQLKPLLNKAVLLTGLNAQCNKIETARELNSLGNLFDWKIHEC